MKVQTVDDTSVFGKDLSVCITCLAKHQRKMKPDINKCKKFYTFFFFKEVKLKTFLNAVNLFVAVM